MSAMQHKAFDAPEPAAAEIEALLRPAMRRMASGVSLITTRDADGRPAGMAASSVISVSMEPPSMLVSVNRSASACAAIQASGLFCVNLLGVGHKALVESFSRSEQRHLRFASGAWTEGAGGVPYLADAQANIFCKVALTQSFGSHVLYIGAVFEVRLTGDIDPLLWVNGSFARTSGLEG